MEEMYDVVADVGKYKEFVPWCTDSKLMLERAGLSRMELQIGFPPFVERYACTLTLTRPKLVKVSFQFFQSVWNCLFE